MKNWLGQELRIGSVVYRGARDGNTSTFKIGIIESFAASGKTARVEWHFESSWKYFDFPAGRHVIWVPVRPYGYTVSKRLTKGSPGLESLVLMSGINLDEVDRLCRAYGEDIMREFVNIQEVEDFVNHYV